MLPEATYRKWKTLDLVVFLQMVQEFYMNVTQVMSDQIQILHLILNALK